MSDPTGWVQRAYQHLEHLSVNIGPRPSTGAAELTAAEYVASAMVAAGMNAVRLEPFRAPSSTYAPFRAAFLAALLAKLIRGNGRCSALMVSGLSALAALGFAAESDLAPNWTRLFVAHGDSQNVVGIIPAREERRRILVVYGHIDSHRTPLLYSNSTMLRIFSPLLAAGFVSLLVDAVLSLIQAVFHGRLFDGLFARIVHGVTSTLQLVNLTLTVQADMTPFAPGANDNASGVATALVLGERLVDEPLRHTEVWVLATGCEEVGSYGIRAFLQKHARLLDNALLLDFDMVGIGAPAFIPKQGLLRKRFADRQMLAAARTVAEAYPEFGAWEHATDAYDDSYMVARMGFRGMTIDAEGVPGSTTSAEHKHWHRLSDTIDKIDQASLAMVHGFAWTLVQQFDSQDD